MVGINVGCHLISAHFHRLLTCIRRQATKNGRAQAPERPAYLDVAVRSLHGLVVKYSTGLEPPKETM